ncbi:MAG: hypothetical protein ACPLYF_01000, partial [Fervidobacterium sp.]
EVFEKRLKTNPLTADEIGLRRQLTEKLDARTITPDEAKLAEAQAVGNILAVLAILFLIGLVIVFLSD